MLAFEENLDSPALDQGFQQFRGRRIELALHQPVHQMNQRHRCACLGKTMGRLQSEQSAADHDDTLLAGSQRQQPIDIAAVAKGVDACQVGARQIQPQRGRTGGKHQPGEHDTFFIGDLEFAAANVDLGGHTAVFQGDAARAPPIGGLELDVVRLRLARQHRRQQHAIIGEPRLVADDRNGVPAERDFCQFIDETGSGHACC